MNRRMHIGVASAGIVAVLAIALPADAQRRSGGGTGAARAAPSSISHPSAGASGTRANTGSVNANNRTNTGNVNSGNKVNTGNVNTGNRVNTGNINTGDININVDQDWDHYGGVGVAHPIYHPVATGVVAGAVVGAAVATTVAIGTMAYALPPGCSPYVYSSYNYFYCGSVYYKPQYQGDTVVYVVVDKPG